jgi:hypothetical protein
MPVTQERGGTYPRPFAVVSAALWEKYEGHKFVTNVEPLAAAVDAHGTLHCRRLLTMQGKLPMALRPLLGATPLYLLEEVVVDAKVSLLEYISSTCLMQSTISIPKYFTIMMA